MPTNLSKYKDDVESLCQRGLKLLHAFYYAGDPKVFIAALEKSKVDVDKFVEDLPVIKTDYQGWYSEALALVRQLLPDRLDDFRRLYEKPRGRKELGFESYRIEDALQGLTITRYQRETGPSAAIPHMEQQLAIVNSIKIRLESSLFDITQLLQADLFDSELESARELWKKGFYRAAGAIAGVVLEKHLGQVCRNHGLTSRKSHPTISDYNDQLKSASVLDTPEWRKIQRLGDLRNLCDHGKDRDPKNEEVDELITAVDKLIKTLF